MDDHSGYIITEQNAQMLANITGKDISTIKANIGWAVVFVEESYPEWFIMPKNVALTLKDFKWVDSDLNGLPARSQKEIREEWAKVNKEYAQKLDELQKELNRAILRDGETDGDNSKT